MEHNAAKLFKSIRQRKLTKLPWIEEGDNARLPAAYKKYWYEYVSKSSPIHYRKDDKTWKRNEETGELKRVDPVPIEPFYPKEAHQGLWGNEGIVKGYQKRQELRKRVPHYWVPTLHTGIVYSEILNKYMSAVVTRRLKILVTEHFGLDHYLLKTPANDLRSNLALGLKRKMLLALRDKTLYPDDPEKQAQVYDKYKHYLNAYTHEEIEWYGLSPGDAHRKFAKIEEEANAPKPLKILYRYELLNELRNPPEESSTGEIKSKPSEWIKKINPFASRN